MRDSYIRSFQRNTITTFSIVFACDVKKEGMAGKQCGFLACSMHGLVAVYGCRPKWDWPLMREAELEKWTGTKNLSFSRAFVVVMSLFLRLGL
jgi:hypothetical protein